MKLFGFEIKRKQDDEEKLQSFAPDISDDGAVLVAASGFTGQFVDLEGTLKNEAQLVNQYRELAGLPEIDIAIKNIVNESIVQDDLEKTVSINLEDIPELPPRLKEIIEQEFDAILGIMQFNKHGYETFKRWYIDGRGYFHIVVDQNPQLQQMNGIREIRYLDPRKIRKIKVVQKKGTQIQQGPGSVDAQSKTQAEYYVYNPKGFDSKETNLTGGQKAVQGIKISVDSIIHVVSGLTDRDEKMVYGYLHKAIKPMNQLKSLEDASIIHSLSRAPQRRVFNIEVGNLPRNQVEGHIQSLITKNKNKLVYDQATGSIQDQRKFMTMNEDYWFATRGGIGNKIDTLPPGPNIAENMNIDYFQRKVFYALDVPIGRLSDQGGGGFDMGRATEISRDELNFQKLIDRLRLKFSDLFLQALEKQLILKNIVTPEDWDAFSNKIKFKYARDIYMTELKDREIMQERINLMNQMMPLIGTFYSEAWVKRNVLHLSEEDMEKMEIEMNGEINSRLNQQKMMDSGMMEQAQGAENGQ